MQKNLLVELHNSNGSDWFDVNHLALADGDVWDGNGYSITVNDSYGLGETNYENSWGGANVFKGQSAFFKPYFCIIILVKVGLPLRDIRRYTIFTGNIIKNLGFYGTTAIKGIGRTYNNGSMTSRSDGNSYSANHCQNLD